MNKLRVRFTKWYVNRGYKFRSVILHGEIEGIWDCPFWVRPLLIFFSPSVYVIEVQGKNMAKWFENGIKEGIKNGWRMKESEE